MAAVLALALSSCGSGSTKTVTHRLPAPSADDIAALGQILLTTPVGCSFANIGSATPKDLQATVTQLEGMFRRDNPDAPITVTGPGAPMSTTLRQVIGNVIRILDGNGQPTCDPGLGAQLSQATGVPSS